MDLQIVPTRDRAGYLIHMEDHDCSRLPEELKYVDPITAKGLCQFIIDNTSKLVYVRDDERPIWQALFDKINYEIEFVGGKLKLRGINGFELRI